MKKMPFIFKYNVWFKDCNGKVDYEDTQSRFVVAYDEDEADVKMNRYAKNLKKEGFGELVFVCMSVEMDNVII